MQENINNLLSVLEHHTTEKRYASTIDLMWFLCRLMEDSVVESEISSGTVARLCQAAINVLPIIDCQVQEEDIRIEFRNVLNELAKAIFVLGQKKQVDHHILTDLKTLLNLNLESKPVRSIIWDDLTSLDWESANESAFKKFEDRRLKLRLALNQEVQMLASIKAGKAETGYLKTLQCYGRMILPWFSSLIYQRSSTGIKQDTIALLAPLELLINGVLPFLKDDRALGWELLHIYLYWIRDRSALPPNQSTLETFVQSAMSSTSHSLVALSYCARLVITDAYRHKKEALFTLCEYVLQLENGLAKKISVSTLSPVLFNDRRASLQKIREVWQTPITNFIDSASTKPLSKKPLLQKMLNQSLHSTHNTHKQKIFSKGSVRLIQTLLAENVAVLGEPPGKFALFLLGSSSRNDRLPHSDIECALVYEATPEQASSMRAYFYTLLSLLEFSVIRLGETQDLIAGSYAGFHLDSGEHVLSTQNKLIGTVEQLYDWHVESTISHSPGDLIVSSSVSDEIKGKFLYSMLNPCLVNREWGGRDLFLAYQSKVQSLLNKPIDSWTRHAFKQTYFENKRIEDKQHKLLDEKQLSEELGLLVNPDSERPQEPAKTHHYLTLRQMVALYCWVDILRKAEETLLDAQQTKNPATQSKINIKDVYHKPLVYLALNLQLFLGTSEKHPVHMFEAAFIAGILPLEVKILLQEMFSCIIQIRSDLHFNKKAQEEETFLNALSPTDQMTLEIIKKILLRPMKTIMEDLLMKEVKNEISLPSWIITLHEAFNQIWTLYCKSRFDWQTRLLTHPLLMCLTNHPEPGETTSSIDRWLAQKKAQQQRLLLASDDAIFQTANNLTQPTVWIEQKHDRQDMTYRLHPVAVQSLLDKNYLTANGKLLFSTEQPSQENKPYLSTTITLPASNEDPALTLCLTVYSDICASDLATTEFSLLFVGTHLPWIESLRLTINGKSYPAFLSYGMNESLLTQLPSTPQAVLEMFLPNVEPKTDHLPAGSVLVEKLALKDETVTGEKLLTLTRNVALSSLSLESTQVRLEDLKTLLTFSGCTDVEICLGENHYLRLEAWQYLLHSSPCHHFSLKLATGEILGLKGKATTNAKILPSNYLHTISELKKLSINNDNQHLQSIETLLVQAEYPFLSFKAYLDYQVDRKARSFIISSFTYLVRLLEERNVAPIQYLHYYRQLNKSWRQIFYDFISQNISAIERCRLIQNFLGEYPDSDGNRRFTWTREQAFQQKLIQLIEPSTHPAFSNEKATLFKESQSIPSQTPTKSRSVISTGAVHTVNIEGLTPGKACLDKELIQTLINEGWLIADNAPHHQSYDFNFARKEERTIIMTTSSTSSVLHGNHLVIPILYKESQFHAKVQPDFPGMEIAYSLLSDRIMGRGSPLVELWKWQCGPKTYPVLLSETIVGENLTPLLTAYPLELMSYQRLVLMAMLTNPGDGNPGNFIAQKIKASDGRIQLKLVSIDNDRLFAPPFEAGKLRTATMLYCFNEIQLSLHQDLREIFLSLNAYEVLEAWLSDLEALNQQYSKIFKTELERPDTYNQCSYLLTMLKQQTISELFKKIKLLQYWLSIKPQIALIKLLAKIQPSLANHYQSVRTQYAEPIERFEQAVKNEYRREEIQGVKRYTSTMRMEQYLKMQGREITLNKTVASYWQQDFTQAKQELRNLSISREVIELAKLQLLQGNLKGFEDLPEAYGQEEVLASIHFNQAIRDAKGLPDSQGQQIIISSIIHSPGLKPLEKLIISHCAITDKQLEQLLKRLPNLKTLKLTNCPLIKESFHETLFDSNKLPKQLQTCILEEMTGIEKVRLTSHSIQYLAIKRAQNLKAFYIDSDSLTQLNLSQKSDQNSNPLASCHQFDIDAKSLQEADFSGNLLLTDEHLQKIALNCQNLKQMNLQDCDENKIHYRALKEVIPAFAEKVVGNQEEEIYLQVVSGALSAITENRTEKELALRNVKNLSGWLWKCLCMALMENQSIESITATSFTTFGNFSSVLNDEDASQLAKVLEHNQTLKKIDLHTNNIGDMGISTLSEALKHNQTLTAINLEKNNIGNQGIATLSQALECNQVLQKINLKENNIGHEGVLTLIKMLERNKRIQISLTRNPIDCILLEHYYKIRLSHYFQLHIYYNDPSEDDIDRALSNGLGVSLGILAAPVLLPAWLVLAPAVYPALFAWIYSEINNFSSKENYKPNIFAVNPFTFFSEQADREVALSLPEKRQRKFNLSLQESFTSWEKLNENINALKHDQLLQAAAFQFGFQCLAIEKDGNCLFEAISQQLIKLFPKQESLHHSHAKLRELAVNYLIAHQDFYEGFVEDRSFDSFMRKMRLPGTWAENIVLNALAHLLNVSIVVINSDQSDPIVLKKPHPLGTIYLGYAINVHYQLLTLDNHIIPQKNINYFVNSAPLLETPASDQTAFMDETHARKYR